MSNSVIHFHFRLRDLLGTAAYLIQAFFSGPFGIFIHCSLYFQACQKLVEAPDLKSCLMEFSYSFDPLLQNVVAKIVLAMIESHENK